MKLPNEIVSTIIQLIAFSLIPFIAYLFRKNKKQSFLQYIGLYKAETKSVKLAVLASALVLISGIALTFFNEGIRQAILNPPSITGELRLSGFSLTTILILLTVAILKTSLAEEILFRGFITKRTIKIFGFKTGNIIQATIFGLIHVLLFWFLTKTSVIFLILIFGFTFSAGWIIGLINEKYGNGSIIPGWIAHGLGNTLAYFIIAFVL